MTRDADQYVDLDDRVEIARRANASLFVSIHADTLRGTADVSGSTVYKDADRASDAEAARIAASENAADRSAGSEKGHDDAGVATFLFILQRRETRAYAHIFSRGLVDHLRGATKLNHNPERSAGFVVLKAPDSRPFWLNSAIFRTRRTFSPWCAGVAGQGGRRDDRSHRCVLQTIRPNPGARPPGDQA